MNPRAEGPSIPEVSSTKGITDAGGSGRGSLTLPQWFLLEVSIALATASGTSMERYGTVDVVLASGIHHGDVSGYPLGSNEVCSGSSAGKSL